MHPIQDKASQFSTLLSQDEWRGRSGQQKCKKDYSQGYRDVQRLAQEVAFCFTCLLNWGSDIDWGNSIFTGLWNGGCFACRSEDSFSTCIQRSRTRRSWLGSSTIPFDTRQGVMFMLICCDFCERKLDYVIRLMFVYFPFRYYNKAWLHMWCYWMSSDSLSLYYSLVLGNLD